MRPEALREQLLAIELGLEEHERRLIRSLQVVNDPPEERQRVIAKAVQHAGPRLVENHRLAAEAPASLAAGSDR